MTGSEKGVRLAIGGGGTGGHVLPALAVVETLCQRASLDEIVWIGSSDGVEQAAAERASIRFIAIPTGKLRRYLSLRNLTDAARVPLGVIAARKALSQFRPNVVLSTGGFVSVPTVIAAWGLAPVVTHEQTAILGLATRINARFATVLAVSHQESVAKARQIHRQVALTGNPVRTGLASGDRAKGLARFGFSSDLPVVFATGGARGASPINERIAKILPQLLDQAQVIHQTGPASANADAERMRALQAELPADVRERYVVVEFVGDELADVYAAADLVVGRAGAGTVAELAFVGKPAILIPLPGTGGDEQTANARVLENVGAAVVIPQHEATPQRLLAEVLAICRDPGRRERMSRAARSVAQPEAAERLADIVVSLTRGGPSVKAR